MPRRSKLRHGSPQATESAVMKIGMITDSLPDTGFDAMLEVAARLGMDMLEFGCGNWSTAPHLQLDRLLGDDSARRDLRARLDRKSVV